MGNCEGSIWSHSHRLGDTLSEGPPLTAQGLFSRSMEHLWQAGRPVWKQEALYGDIRNPILTVTEVKLEMGDGGMLWCVYPWATSGREHLPSALGGLQIICLRQWAGPDGWQRHLPALEFLDSRHVAAKNTHSCRGACIHASILRQKHFSAFHHF